jgi:DNA-binding GntR family transcriptional regulator
MHSVDPPPGNLATAVKDGYSALGEHVTKDRAVTRSREIAYEAVKSAILRGVLPPRERLIEERLGEALGLSRTPVREALAILEHEGLIESIPYKGLMVRRITVGEFLQMYEALGTIEAALAQAAVHHATPDDVQAMATILDRAERTIPDDVAGHLDACREFQQRLGDCARNPYLTRMLLSIEERSDIYLLHTQHHLPAERMLAAVHDRRAILEAVRSGDAASAARAAQVHAEAIRVRWRDLYVHDET